MIKKDTLYKITAASLEKYLLLNDWVRDYGFPNRKLMVFHLDDETIAMPSCEKYKDFYISLPDILETLSDIYMINQVKKLSKKLHHRILICWNSE